MEKPVEIRCPKCLTWYITVQDKIEKVFKRSIFPKCLEFHVFIFSSFSTKITSSFLAHLSRRLRGELIVYQSSRRPSVSACVGASVCSHFQT